MNDKAFLLAWVLSVETCRQHYPDTALYTDSAGARLLDARLKLPFKTVSTALDKLNGHDPAWWMLGKLHAYQVQNEPFVHTDYDVFLWKPLPARLTAASVFAQNPESVIGRPAWYSLEECENAIESFGDVPVPPAWEWYRSQGPAQTAANCGVVGGCDWEFMRSYARTAIDLLEGTKNRSALSALPDYHRHNVVFEQYLLSACAAFHGLKIEYLFETDNWDEINTQANQSGCYTHLLGPAKTNPDVICRLENRVATDYPSSYARCMQIAAEGFGNNLEG